MRVAHVLGSAGLGGAEGFFERLCIAQAAAGEHILPVIRREPGRAARLRAGGLEPVELGFGGYLDLRTGPRLERLLREFRPDVVVAWQNRANRFVPRGRLMGGPWPLAGRLGGYYDLRYYRRCDHILGNTQGLRNWFLQEGWPPERAHALPNFVPDLAGAIPAMLPAPAGVTRLLAMGRLHPNKGFDTLLRALAQLPGMHLSLAGDGPERAALGGLARELGVADRVALLGWREDAGALLAGCDLFVCPSRHEPLGNVVLEAWSAGRPVIAGDAAGPVELITPGVSGLLVPREDAAALAQAIAALAAQPERAATLAAAGRAAYERDYAEAPVLARWRAFLEAVAGSEPVGRAA